MNKEQTKSVITIMQYREKVMQAFIDGIPLQSRPFGGEEWSDNVIHPCWDWEKWEWRIKPLPKKEIVVGTYQHGFTDQGGYYSHSCFGGTNRWDELIRKTKYIDIEFEVVLREKQ